MHYLQIFLCSVKRSRCMPAPELLPAHDDLYARSAFWRWLALVAALMAWGFDGVEQSVYAIMTRPALKDLVPNGGDSESTIGFFFSLSMAMWLWGAAVGGVLFGRLGARYGRVRGLLVSVTTYSVFTGLSALSTHWAHLAAFRFLGALGLGGTWPLAVALLMETWPENRRGVLAGAIAAAANVGFLIASVYSGIMRSYGCSWRWVIGMGCVIGLMSLPVIFFVPEPTKWKLSRAQRQRSSIADLFTRQYRRSTIVGSLLSTVALLGAWGAFLWLATYVDKLAEGTAYHAVAGAKAQKWASYGQILGGFLGGLVAGWLGGKKSWCLICVGAWICLVTLFGFARQFDTQVLVMAIVAGIFVTAFFGWLPKFLSELYPTRIRATGQGFAYNIGRILTGLGVLGTGTLVKVFGGNYGHAVMTMATVYLLGLLVIWFAPDTGGKMHEDRVDAADIGPVPELKAVGAARLEGNT
jgi:MFS transporter, SHS family, sialic acid transporter